ncbi:hypothetical protein TNCV_2699811 [Trichonephila clavipes]|nr:hypothetical protein TNCV_2699811 [Trichonephila clavipes]
MWPRRKTVAEFRLTAGHDCLLKYRIHVALAPYCTCCDFREDMDADHIRRCPGLRAPLCATLIGNTIHIHLVGGLPLVRDPIGFLKVNCGLSFTEIGQRVGRNQATVIRICHRWVQEKTTGSIASTSLYHCPNQADCAHGRDGLRSHITNQNKRFNMLRIIRCPLVSFDAVCSRIECPLPSREVAGIETHHNLLLLSSPMEQWSSFQSTPGREPEQARGSNGTRLSKQH